jgi:hypothetical protein
MANSAAAGGSSDPQSMEYADALINAFELAAAELW